MQSFRVYAIEGLFMATMTPSRPRVFNLPNQLTAARFVLALVLFGLIAGETWLWCLIVFALAAFTDWLDGYLARRQNLTSTLGRIMDPLVDKVLLCGTYICLLPLGNKDGWLFPWMVTVVVARELVITGLRSYVEQQGTKFGADWLGKLKMVLQCGAVFAVFTWLVLQPWSKFLSDLCAHLRDGLIWAMVAATLISGVQYVWKAAALYNVDA
jgi:CDP-diacylglycerol--glycerol-3-phosphate 3-phosphatidyltransferase